MTHPDGSQSVLPDAALALIYWRRLRAPTDRICAALRCSETDIDAIERQLCEARLPASDYPQVRFSSCAPPAAAADWSERHAATLLRQGFERDGDTPFIFIPGMGGLTVAETRHLVTRTAAALHASGIRQGDIVALDSRVRLESWLGLAATLLIGATASRLDAHAGDETLAGMMRIAPAAITLTGRPEAFRGVDGTGRIIVFDAPDSAESFEAWLEAAPDPGIDLWNAARISPTDAALIGFTSGSSGRPKCVLTSHEAVYRSSEAQLTRFGYGPDDVFASATDLTATSALRCVLTLPLMCGGRVVLPDEDASRHSLALALQCTEYGVTRLMTIPGVLRGWLQSKARMPAGALAALRSVMSGAGALDGSTARRFEDAFGIPVVDNYGARETATTLYSFEDRPGSLSDGGGRASEVLMRLVDDALTPVATGETGEICVHTDCMMKGYAGDDDNAIGRSGIWHRTGDLGRLTGDGAIEVIGRKREIIKTPEALFIVPVEIESLLNALPFIQDAAVFPYRDAEGTERAGAAVELADTTPQSADLVTTMRETVAAQIGPFKVPHRIVIVDALPRVGRDKPDKRRLARQFEAAAISPASGKTEPAQPA